MLGIYGVNALRAKIVKTKAKVGETATNFVKRKTTEILTELVNNTPQFTGDLAASWTVVTNSFSPLYGYSPLKDDVGNYNLSEYPAKFKGDKEALRIALAVNSSILASIKYNTIISIQNTSPTAVKLQTGAIREGQLRPGNFIPGDVLAIKHTLNKFRFTSAL